MGWGEYVCEGLTGVHSRLLPAFTCVPAELTAQVKVIAEGQGSAVHVLHTGRGEDSRVLPDTE